MKNLSVKMNVLGVNMEQMMKNKISTIKRKLSENCGADGSIEKTSWLVVALIIGAIVIGIVVSSVPELGDMVMDKIKEFFNFATVS